MKQTLKIRAAVLCCGLLVLPRSSAAQAALVTAEKRTEPTAITTPLTVVLPAGTHLLMKLVSPLDTVTSTPGSSVYLEMAFPVIQNDRVVIPEHTRVLGTVADERRPGRVKGRAQMRLRFNQLILPDNRVLLMDAGLQSLPGSRRNRTVDSEGTVEPVDQIDADVYTIAKTTGAGVLVGSIRHVGIGVGQGALIGAGLGVAKVLFTRGNEISLPEGTRVEMVLQRPLIVPPAPSLSPKTSNDSADAKAPPASREVVEKVPGAVKNDRRR